MLTKGGQKRSAKNWDFELRLTLRKRSQARSRLYRKGFRAGRRTQQVRHGESVLWRTSRPHLKADAADTAATMSSMFLIAEEAAVANELGNLRWNGFVPGFVAAGDALKHVS